MQTRSAAAAFFTFATLSASAAFATPALITTLATFTGTANGSSPLAGLIADASGNLYGTTVQGGLNNLGTVFKIAAGTEALSTLVTFDGSNGATPFSGLVADTAGNFYGTTFNGNNVYEIAAGTNNVTTLATFTTVNRGFQPICSLIMDSSGSLYGTTEIGGSGGSYGTVFKLAAGATAINTLATFNSSNGAFPVAGLLEDGSGNFYGTTQKGGANAYGTVFKVAGGTNHLSTVVTFNNTNGAYPGDALIADASGNFYGTASSGGSSGDGTVFKIAAGTGTIITLLSFNSTNGARPNANLIADASGNLYGTTQQGGSSNDGTVFELTGTGFVVPEPGSLTLAGVGCLALLRRRRRSCKGILTALATEPSGWSVTKLIRLSNRSRLPSRAFQCG